MDVHKKVNEKPHKKLVFSALLLATCIFSLGLLAETFQLGDLAPRGAPDGQLNAADSLLLQRIILGDIVPTNDEMQLGDVAPLGNVDGVLNAGDLVVQQRAVLGQITLGTIETDTTPPAVINLEAFSIDTSTVGQLTLTGLAGAVEAGATLNITNNTLGQSYTVVVDSAGAFSITIAGLSGDTLLITVEDGANNTSSTSQYVVGAIQMLTPNDTDTINDNSVNVYGTFIGPANTGVLVNGVPACVNGNEFYINNVSLLPGVNTVSAVLTRQNGDVSSEVTQVNSTGTNNLDVNAVFDCGVAPLDTAFEVSVNGITVQQFDIDFEGDSVIDITSATIPDSTVLSSTYTSPGIYPAEITITHASGTITENLYIVVHDVVQQDAIFQTIWTNMWTALVAGDKTTALKYVSPDSKSTYDAVFNTLMPHMSDINDRMTSVRSVSVGGNIASCAVLKNGSGQNKFYMINFKRDYDGVWRTDSM